MTSTNNDLKMYVTIDTEMDADIHWIKHEPKSFTSVTEGIPNYLRPIWDRYGVNPIYFVSPEVAENIACCKVLIEEIKRGAIIGAHLHPEFIEPNKKWKGSGESSEFPCFAYSREIEKEKIYNLKRLIEENLGVTPIWYRAARFGADSDTWNILAELGFKYDSSITPEINWKEKGGPDFSKVRLNQINCVLNKEVKEVPISIMGKRWGLLGRLLPDNWLYYRWLRPTHMTYIEEKHLIKELWDNGHNSIVIMFHTMEIMVNKSPYVRCNWMQSYYLWRLKKTIEYAKSLGYKTEI